MPFQRNLNLASIVSVVLPFSPNTTWTGYCWDGPGGGTGGVACQDAGCATAISSAGQSDVVIERRHTGNTGRAMCSVPRRHVSREG
ncbi:hypothetical protein N656DRAFT_82831 [Canariomyces notabilis]|uniref:Uncharacterized protein n=1 Tax=Canariomyces notabilis TaxID=2074819 RepID=A0AAN6TEH6_9PEZI|nr:hypothetical protein N656DRAFT_82831 [Canariomyces arenarius]